MAHQSGPPHRVSASEAARTPTEHKHQHGGLADLGLGRPLKAKSPAESDSTNIAGELFGNGNFHFLVIRSGGGQDEPQNRKKIKITQDQ